MNKLKGKKLHLQYNMYIKVHKSYIYNMVKNGYIYKVNKKHFTMFFKESVLYPFVRFYDTPKGLTQKWGLCRYFDVCPKYWYYHSFINKLKIVKKYNLCVLLFYLEIVQFSRYLQKLFGVPFPPNFIRSVFITIYYSVSRQSVNMCLFAQWFLLNYSGCS